MSNPQASDEVNLSLGLQLLQGLEDLAEVVGQSHMHLCAEEESTP